MQIWGLWWTFSVIYAHVSSLARRRRFTSSGWYTLQFGTPFLRGPIEPWIKIVLPLFGIAGELRLGHSRYQALHTSDGKFDLETIRDWQHSTMYFAFVASGIADLAVHHLRVNKGFSRAFLGLGFLIEGVLLVFHLKGPEVEIKVHLILALQVFATVIAMAFEAAWPHNVVAALARPYLTIIQGAWWIQTAYVMYRKLVAWDPEYMGSDMMVPVLCVFHLAVFALATLVAYGLAKRAAEKAYGRTFDDAEDTFADDVRADATALELASLTGGADLAERGVKARR